MQDQNEKGNLRLVTGKLVSPTLSAADIIGFFKRNLSAVLTPYPGPNSIVNLDNMPCHQKHESELQEIVNSRSAYLLWNPPNSPDLNPIEKFWDIVIAHSN